MKNLTQRLFFALWPDDAVRDQLMAVRQSYLQDQVCRPTHRDNLHITLVFLGNLALAEADCVIAAANKLQARRFELAVDCVCTWQHNHILWAGMSELDGKAQQLTQMLQNIVRGCDANVEKRTWQPHITLARNYPQGLATPIRHTAITWQVQEFVLVESLHGDGRSVYQVRQRWQLGE